jgi:16S rRNA (cytidine1402-2'-O)-methyltransferase
MEQNKNKNILFVVGTPIGNLGDVSSRASQILSDADSIACEDTRVTKKLLDKLGIKKKVISYHQHSCDKTINNIIDFIKSGKTVALVTDAGTPGISDPGGKLVEACVKNNINIIPIPGACALTAAISISGFPTDRFTFLGFPPNKKGREKYFHELSKIEHAIIIYESTHRIEKTLNQLPSDRQIVVCRELTKLHETIYRGTSSKILDELNKTSSKGEFVIILAPKIYE